MELRKKYNELQKKYGLPSYDGLDSDFELLYVSPITEINFPLRFIRRRINDKLAFFCSMLQGVLQPNPSSLIALQESKFLDEDDSKKVRKLLKEMMFMERQSLLFDINHSEKDEAELIKDVFKKWPGIKKQVHEIFSKIKENWKKEIKKKEESYFG